MPLHRVTAGPIESNMYIAHAEKSEGCIIVDAGDAGDLIRTIEKLKLRPEILFLTHGHFDHSAACSELKARFPDMSIVIHEAERETMLRPTLNLSYFLGDSPPPPDPDRLARDGDEFVAGGLTMRVIHTPGHTPGGACLYGEIDGRRTLFSGDTLFAGGVGRTDLPGGSYEVLIESIMKKLFTLPDDTEVHPGHGGSTTIEEEKAENPFVG